MKSNTPFALWPIAPFGGEDGDDDGNSGNDASQGNSGGNANSNGSQGNSGQGNQGAPGGKGKAGATNDDADDDDDDDEFSGYSAKELRRIAADHKKAARKAESEAQEFKDKQAAEERKKNDDVTNLTKDLDTERETVKTLRATVVKQAIEGAIRDDARFEWHDVEMVAAQLDPEVVKVDDKGRVEGIKGQLPKVAKNHPFLLKKDNTDSNNNNGNANGNAGQSNNGPTGFQPGQGGTSGGGGNEVDTKKLAENYPALAGRM